MSFEIVVKSWQEIANLWFINGPIKSKNFDIQAISFLLKQKIKSKNFEIKIKICSSINSKYIFQWNGILKSEVQINQIHYLKNFIFKILLSKRHV